MKVLHVPFHFYPDAVGGTEVYALSLAQRLRQMGHEAEIAAPGDDRTKYEHEGVQVHRFAVGKNKNIAASQWLSDETTAGQFEEILDTATPQLVHLHGISTAISLSLVQRIKLRGIPVVLTAHIPGVVCGRGTLLEHGHQVCDGAVAVVRCSACVLEDRGLRGPLARIVASMPASVGDAIGALGSSARWVTALRMTSLQTFRLSYLGRFFQTVDRIVAVSEWLRQVLLRAGVPDEKLLLCRHGTTQVDTVSLHPRRAESSVKKIAYLGRVTETKGLHTVIDAVLNAPHLPLILDVYSILQNAADREYAHRLKIRSENDNRIRFLEPVPNSRVPQLLEQYDVLAVPSIWLETGPLTIYDAFAARIPVIGSRRGGIAELVTHELNGLLVDAQDVPSWVATLKRVCSEKGLLERLRTNIPQPRTMSIVAAEMLSVYQQLQHRS